MYEVSDTFGMQSRQNASEQRASASFDNNLRPISNLSQNYYPSYQ